ncbi:hypothetical protein CPB83DRAFT_897570 [Crepidotus variabilis]|uniref:Osmotin, thaumatin-like protein n=1 Tax=Crepidotus variabilis TaxID=179855 RepID=A0A9P6E8P7_9AGAR|nr:hypothetical protein CPB83DRAFT_897570 [Crepidotus variabilis]
MFSKITQITLLLTLAAATARGSLLSNELQSRQTPPPTDRQYIVVNNCPTPIDLYIGTLKDNTMPTHGKITKFSQNFDVGPFWSDINSGSIGGSTRVGFHDDYYYVIAGFSLNVGVHVEASPRPPNSGFCIPIDCQHLPCSNTFFFPPPSFPEPTEGPPPSPYFRCPLHNETFTITFCPSGSFPF